MLRAWRRATLRLEVEGAENLPEAGAVLVVANHVSFRDPLLLVMVAADRGRRLRALAVEAAFRYPVTGWFLRTSGMIPVPPRHGRASAVAAAAAALAAGEAVLVYPEGTIPPPGRVLPAQPGVGWLALQSGAPVVPVASRGLERLGARARLRAWVGRGLRRRPVWVVVGSPVDLDDLRKRYTAAGRPDPTGAAAVAADRCLTAVRGLAARAGRARN